MGSRYLTDLADVLRRAGLRVTEYQGWKTRARGSGGYDGSRPWGVMWHHTASGAGWDGQRDADYCAVGDSSAPLANLYVDRTGLVWVLAAGATNTNGKGGPLKWSRGTVPLDSMNTHAIGVELGNNGVGEPWPQVQVDAMFAVNNACAAAYGFLASDLATHNLYAPTRKIDPATAAAVQGPWRPRSVNSSGSWSTPDIAAEAVRRMTAGPQPTPEPEPEPDDEDDDMAQKQALLIQSGEGGNTPGSWAVTDVAFRSKTFLDGPDVDALTALGYERATVTGPTFDRIPGATQWQAVE